MFGTAPLLALSVALVVPAAVETKSSAHPADAPPSATCRDGWSTPAPGSTEYEQGLSVLAGYFGITGGIEVAEIRYFTGPDSPGIIEPRFDPVLRWYLEVSQVADPGCGVGSSSSSVPTRAKA